MLKYRHVPFPLGRAGIDSKSDPTAVPFGKYVTLKNCDLSTPGKIKKRPGFSVIPLLDMVNGGTLGQDYAIKRIAARKRELLAFSDAGSSGANVENSVFSRHTQSSGGFTAQTGRLVPIHAYYQRPAAFEGDARTQDQASSSQGLSVYAWEDGNGAVKYVSVDRNGSRAVTPSTISNAVRPKVVAFGASGEVWLFWVDSGAFSLKVRKFTPGSLSTSDFTLVTDVLASTDASYDVAITASTTAVFGYTSTTANTVKVRILTTAGSLSGTTFDWNHGTANALAVAIAVDPGNANVGLLAFTNTPRVFAIIRTSGLAAVASGTLSSAGTANGRNVTCGFDTAGTLRALVEVLSVTATYLYQTWAGGALTTGGAVTDCNTLIWTHSALASKLVRIGTALAVLTVYDSALQATYFINHLDTTGGWVEQGRMLPQTAGGITVRLGHLPQIESRGSNEYFFAGLKRSLLQSSSSIFTSNGAQSRRQLVGISLRVQPSDAYCSAVLGESLYIAGAQLHAYDGVAIREAGVAVFYENAALGATPSAAAGSLTVGTYYYRLYWESYNAQGERDISTCAAALVATVTGGNDTLTFAPLSQFQSTANKTVGLAIYRTEVNPTSASSFYRVSSTDPTATGANGYVANDLTVNFLPSFVDKMSDATLITKELDYQNSRELGHLAAPPCRMIAASGERLFVAGCEGGSEVWPSKLTSSGQVAAFHPALMFTVPDDGGDITALAVYDNMLFIFKATKVYVMDATGPDNLGNGGWDTPRLVSSDIGAVDWRCVVISKSGIFWRGYKGIYFVDRSLQVQQIGQPIEAYLVGATVTSAVATADTNYVRFQLSTGSTLVFDYEIGIWMEHTDPGRIGQVAFIDETGTPQLYIASSTSIDRLDTTVWTDEGAAFEMRWKSGVLNFDGSLQNVKRLRSVSLFGTYKAAHTVNLNVTLYQAGAAVTTLSNTWAATTTFQHRYQTTQQRCEAVQIEVFESSGSGTQQGAEYQEVALELGGEGKPWKLGATQTT